MIHEHDTTGYRRRTIRTTIPEPADQKAPDLLNRDYTTDAPNQRHVGDITHLPIPDDTNVRALRFDRSRPSPMIPRARIGADDESLRIAQGLPASRRPGARLLVHIPGAPPGALHAPAGVG